MRKLFLLIAALVIVPIASSAQERETKKIIIFPFKVISKTGSETFSREMSAVLGAELA